MLLSENITFDISLSGTGIESNIHSATASYTLSSGSQDVRLTINTTDDQLDEPEKNIQINVSKTVGQTGYNIRRSQQEIELTILDNDNTSASLTFVQGGTTTSVTQSTTVSEEGGSLAVKAVLVNAKPYDTSILFGIAGTATFGEDYTAVDRGYVSTVLTGGNNIKALTAIVPSQTVSGSIFYVEGSNQIKVLSSSSDTTPENYNSTNNNSSFANFGMNLSEAGFGYIQDLSTDAEGNLYVIDQNYIRKITTQTTPVRVEYVAGSANYSQTPVNGTGSVIRFNNPRRIAANADGSVLYVLEDNRIRKITFNDSNQPVAETVVGNGSWSYVDGPGLDARLQGPNDIAVNNAGDLIIAEYGSLRKYSNGVVSTLIQFGWQKSGIVLDANDNVYFSSADESQIYKYDITSQSVGIVAGRQNQNGTVDGPTKSAKIERPETITFYDGELFFIQRDNRKLRKVDFLNRLRILAGETEGTFTLNILNDDFYEVN